MRERESEGGREREGWGRKKSPAAQAPASRQCPQGGTKRVWPLGAHKALSSVYSGARAPAREGGRKRGGSCCPRFLFSVSRGVLLLLLLPARVSGISEIGGCLRVRASPCISVIRRELSVLNTSERLKGARGIVASTRKCDLRLLPQLCPGRLFGSRLEMCLRNAFPARADFSGGRPIVGGGGGGGGPRSSLTFTSRKLALIFHRLRGNCSMRK